MPTWIELTEESRGYKVTLATAAITRVQPLDKGAAVYLGDSHNHIKVKESYEAVRQALGAVPKAGRQQPQG